MYKNLKNFLNFSDQTFSLVIVFSLFLIFGQISAPVLIKFVLLKSVCRKFFDMFLNIHLHIISLVVSPVAQRIRYQTTNQRFPGSNPGGVAFFFGSMILL